MHLLVLAKFHLLIVVFSYPALCSAGQFQCRDKSCVDGGDAIRCDGIYQCADGFDEEGCGMCLACI